MFTKSLRNQKKDFVYRYVIINIRKGVRTMNNRLIRALLLYLADLVERCQDTAEAARLIRQHANEL